MSDIFQYENQHEPPSLTDRVISKVGTKSDIIVCFNASTDWCDDAPIP